MGTRKRLRKIRYVPGMISMVLLPTLFIHFASKEIRRRSPQCIKIYWADTVVMKANPSAFHQFQGHFPPIRNYKEIRLTGNPEANRTMMDFAQRSVRELLENADTINGIHFELDENASFGDFIRVVDMLKTEGAKTYMPLNEHLWFYIFPPDTTRSQTMPLITL